MPASEARSFIRYLAAKKSVDSRALETHVLQSLKGALPDLDDGKPLQVLEVGAGIGTMLERLAGWGVLHHACYEALDLLPDNIREAQRLIPVWSRAQGFHATEGPDGGFHLDRGQESLAVRLETADVHDFIAREQGRRSWDLLIAHAFMDLMDPSVVLPGLARLTKPGGLVYLTLNFDGVTILEPPLDPVFDEHILALYHKTMDDRRIAGLPSGDSRTGRHLFTQLPANGIRILDAGSSDWVVYPRSGRYPFDEAYFLHFIIHGIETALKAHPSLDPQRFSQWIAKRRAQIEGGLLVFIAHNLDFLGRREGSG